MKNLSSYDLEPVRYCSKCYSLRVGYIDGIDNSDYCLDCGCTDILEDSIEAWERIYKNRYGHKFIERRVDPLRIKIYRMPWNKLRQIFYTKPYSKEIIRAMCPRLLKYKSKEDMMLSFINSIEKDGRIEEFKEQMYICSKKYDLGEI